MIALFHHAIIDTSYTDVATSRTNAHLRDEGKEKTDRSVRKFVRSGRQRQELLCAASELIGACQIEEETNEQVIGWMWVSNTAELRDWTLKYQ